MNKRELLIAKLESEGPRCEGELINALTRDPNELYEFRLALQELVSEGILKTTPEPKKVRVAGKKRAREAA